MKKLNQKHKVKKKRLKGRIPDRHPFYLDEIGNKQNACCRRAKKCVNG